MEVVGLGETVIGAVGEKKVPSMFGGGGGSLRSAQFAVDILGF